MCIAWNKLPENIRSLASPITFTAATRKLYIDYRFAMRGIPDFTAR